MGEIAVRLALTVIAGILIGYNRAEHGKAAGCARLFWSASLPRLR